MSNFIKVDVSSLSSYQNDFNNEHNYFNNKTYPTFTSGYLKSCGDQYINQMASHLKSYYERVEIGYRNINTWWTGYVNDVEALEKLLSGEGNAAGIEEPAVISAVAKLFNIDTYENTLDGTFGEQGGDYGSAFSFDDQSAIDMANANVFGENPEGKYVTLADRIYNFITSEGAKLKEALTESCVDVYNEDGTVNVWNICKNAYTIYKNKVKLEQATAAAVGLSAGEGLLKLGESLVDLGAITKTIFATGPTALIDGVQALYGMATGKEWKSVTKEMWNNTKTFVAKDHVKTWFDNFYENTNIGKSIKENAFEFDTIRDVTTGISYGIGIVGLTVATMGVGGIAIAGSQAATSAAIATAAGIGKCTQNAWADGAGIVEGLEAGALGGGWEGLQYYIGGKINQFNPFGGTGTASKYLNIGTRAFLDGVDGGAESFVLPAIDAIYKDGYTDASGNYVSFTEKDNFFSRYSNLFESNGGAKGALTNATVGAGISLGSELFDVFKKPKSDVEVIDPDPVLKTPKQELPPNQTIIDTEGHLVDFDYETLDGDIIEDYPSGSFSGEAAKNYSPEIDKLAGVDRKGLPAGPDEVGLATNEPKNLVSGAAEKIESDSVIDAFDDVEMPKQTSKGLDSGIERIDIAEPKTIATVSDSLGDRSALDAFNDVEMPHQTPKGLDSGIKPQETAVPKFTKFDTGKGIDYYIQNIEEFNKNGVSLKQYIENSGEKVISINTNSDLATYFGDGKLFTLDKLKQLSSNPNLSSNERSAIKTLYDIYSNVRVANIDTLKLLNDAAPHLSGSDMEQIMNLLNSGLADTMAQSYSSEQLASVFNYTARGGFEINAWLNDTTLNYGKDEARKLYRDISEIQDIISGTWVEVNQQTGDIIRNKVFTSQQGSILDELDSVITSANYSDNIVAYRGIKELYDGHQQLDISKLKIGDSFMSEGYQSASVLFDNNYGATHADTGIILEVLVPANSGTGCYIENISGCKNYCQTEMLLKRNAKMTVTGDIYKKVVNGIEKTIIPVIIQ